MLHIKKSSVSQTVPNDKCCALLSKKKKNKFKNQNINWKYLVSAGGAFSAVRESLSVPFKENSPRNPTKGKGHCPPTAPSSQG